MTKVSANRQRECKQKTNSEALRRVILGEIRRVIRGRYGHEIPNDDAGREDLEALLRYSALHPTHGREKIKYAIETMASWMQEDEAEMYVDEYSSDIRRLWPTSEWLRDKLQISTAERERTKAWHIPPFDKTAEQFAAYRKAQKSAKRRLREVARPRESYLAGSKSKSRPWESEGISRATWYRRRETSTYPVLRVSRPKTCL